MDLVFILFVFWVYALLSVKRGGGGRQIPVPPKHLKPK